MKDLFLLSSLIFILLFSPSLYCKELEAAGTGETKIAEGMDPGSISTIAREEAIKEAIKNAMEKVLGANALDSGEAKEKLGKIVSQLDSFLIKEDSKPSKIGDSYKVSLLLTIDEDKFRKLLSDEGLASSSTVRSSSIMVIMDEYFTTPSDLNAPLEELVEYKREAGEESKYSEKENAKDKSKGSASIGIYGASATTDASYSKNIKGGSKAHDNTYYKKLVKYQPKNTGPEKTSYTKNSLTGVFQDYDIKILNDSLFRSKYLSAKTITFQDLQSSKDFSKYAELAYQDAKADFFAIGSSVIIDAGENEATGKRSCNALVSVSTFSTKTGEEIASESVSESSAGDTLDQCRGNISGKLAKTIGSILSVRIQDYWKRRAMYGTQYTITYLGDLNLKGKVILRKAIEQVSGVTKVTQRQSGSKYYQMIVTYNGEDPLDQAIGMKIFEIPEFSKLDSYQEGSNLDLCPKKCKKKK